MKRCGRTLIALVVAGCGLAVAALAALGGEPSAQVERAHAAMNALQAALFARLQEELRDGGPATAVAVCREDAPLITTRIAAEHEIELGRTSHRLRNPGNAPRDWARPAVEAGAGRAAAEVEPKVVDLGDRVGVLRPIPTAEPCLACHGPADSLDPAVRQELAESYPEDRATGFEVGDLRGWMWVEVPK